jgi:hypothetical protein
LSIGEVLCQAARLEVAVAADQHRHLRGPATFSIADSIAEVMGKRDHSAGKTIQGFQLFRSSF